MNDTYAINFYPDKTTEGAFCWVAEHLELPGCFAHGATQAEARANLKLVREAYLRQLAVAGIPAPQPADRGTEETEWITPAIEDHPPQQWNLMGAEPAMATSK